MDRPVWEMLEGNRERLSFHMPGHKGRGPFGPVDAYALDTTELPGTDDLYCPENGLRLAQERYARAAGSGAALFLHNGSTAGIQAMLMLYAHPGDTVLLPRNAHLSAVNGCILGDLRPVFMPLTFTGDGYGYLREEISMIFQNPMTCLNPVYTIGNQLVEALRAHDKKISKEEAQKRAMEMMELVGINNVEKRMKQYPHEFSGGMRQRVMIAMGLICHPQLLIADEPTTALDVTIQAQILDLMKDLQKKTGMGIIFITHNLGVVADICDKVSVMYAGKIVEQGPVDDIFYEPAHPYTKGLLRSMPRVDAESYERLIPIEGTPVDMLNPPEGCPFAPRCEHCMKICLKKMPPYVEVGEKHRSACWLRVQELMNKEEK